MIQKKDRLQVLFYRNWLSPKRVDRLKNELFYVIDGVYSIVNMDKMRIVFKMGEVTKIMTQQLATKKIDAFL